MPSFCLREKTFVSRYAYFGPRHSDIVDWEIVRLNSRDAHSASFRCVKSGFC